MEISKLNLKVVGVSDTFPKRESLGIATIIPFEYNGSDNPLQHMRNIMDNGPLFRMYDGKYVKLIVDGQLMMSDTAMERISNQSIVVNAKGVVMIAGLGLGVILPAILDNPNVSRVVVVEKYQDVIDLVKPKYNIDKLEIICSDIHDFVTEEIFDTIYLDIWPIIDTDNLEEIDTLESQFNKNLTKNGYIDSWMKSYLLRSKGIEDGTHCEICGCENDYCECELCESCGEKLVDDVCPYECGEDE